jgi:hypothetical protein
MNKGPLPPLTFGPERDESEWRKLSSEKFRHFCFSPYITTMIKSRMMRWAGQVTRVGEKTKAYKISVGISEGTRPLEKLRLDERIILGCIFTNAMVV